MQIGLLTTVLRTLSLRDKMTAGHSAAVARYVQQVAAEMGLDGAAQETIYTAGLLHHIGKFTFPDSILLSSRRLSAAEFEVVKRHPEQGPPGGELRSDGQLWAAGMGCDHFHPPGRRTPPRLVGSNGWPRRRGRSGRGSMSASTART